MSNSSKPVDQQAESLLEEHRLTELFGQISAEDQALIKWFFKMIRNSQVIKDSIQRTKEKPTRPDLYYYESKVNNITTTFDLILSDSETLSLIKEVKDGIYKKDGRILFAMLRDVAKDKNGFDSFIRGMQYEKGVSWFPGWDLAWEKVWTGSPKVSFGSSQLKRNIDALEKRLQAPREAPEWLVKIKKDDFDKYQPYFALFLTLEPRLLKLSSMLSKYYNKNYSKPLKDLNQEELIDWLKQLKNLLTNKVLVSIRQAMPKINS